MEFILVIVAAFLIAYFLTKDKNPQEEIKEITENVEVEDPVFEKPEGKPPIFFKSYPYFDIAKRKEFQDKLEDNLVDLCLELSKIEDFEKRNVINELTKYNKFRTFTDLPKYLRSFPIDEFLDRGILKKGSKDDLENLLSLITLKELRVICKELNIKSGRSKQDTVDKILQCGKPIPVDPSLYFTINPDVLKIKSLTKPFLLEELHALLNNTKLKINVIGENADPVKTELGEYIENGIYRIQNYGFSDCIYFEGNRAKYFIHDFKIREFSRQKVILHSNGDFLLSDKVTLGDCEIVYILVFDNKVSKIIEERLENPGFNFLQKIDNEPLVYIELENNNNSFWLYNFDERELRVIENPKGKSIYQLIND